MVFVLGAGPSPLNLSTPPVPTQSTAHRKDYNSSLTIPSSQYDFSSQFDALIKKIGTHTSLQEVIAFARTAEKIADVEYAQKRLRNYFVTNQKTLKPDDLMELRSSIAYLDAYLCIEPSKASNNEKFIVRIAKDSLPKSPEPLNSLHLRVIEDLVNNYMLFGQPEKAIDLLNEFTTSPVITTNPREKSILSFLNAIAHAEILDFKKAQEYFLNVEPSDFVNNQKLFFKCLELFCRIEKGLSRDPRSSDKLKEQIALLLFEEDRLLIELKALPLDCSLDDHKAQIKKVQYALGPLHTHYSLHKDHPANWQRLLIGLAIEERELGKRNTTTTLQAYPLLQEAIDRFEKVIQHLAEHDQRTHALSRLEKTQVILEYLDALVSYFNKCEAAPRFDPQAIVFCLQNVGKEKIFFNRDATRLVHQNKKTLLELHKIKHLSFPLSESLHRWADSHYFMDSMHEPHDEHTLSS